MLFRSSNVSFEDSFHVFINSPMRPRPLSPHVRPTCAVTLGSPSPNIHHPGGTGRRLASRGAGPMRTVCSLLFTTSSPTSSDTQGELVAEVTTGRLTLTPAGGPDEELTTAAPALGSAPRQAGRSPPWPRSGRQGILPPQVGRWGPQTGSRARGKSRTPKPVLPAALFFPKDPKPPLPAPLPDPQQPSFSWWG